MSYQEIAFKLIITFALTGIIGIQRENLDKPAGLRTHVLVGLGSCLVMLTGYNMFKNGHTPDATRLAAQVISGIGFLGTGTIIKDKDGIKGLTTGASLWASGCLGVAVGSGFIIGSIMVTLLSLFLLDIKIVPQWQYKITTLKRNKKLIISYQKMQYDELIEKFETEKRKYLKQKEFIGKEIYVVLIDSEIADNDILKKNKIPDTLIRKSLKDVKNEILHGVILGLISKEDNILFFTNKEEVEKFINDFDFRIKTGRIIF